VGNGVRTGAMIAGTDAKCIVHSISCGRSDGGFCNRSHRLGPVPAWVRRCVRIPVRCDRMLSLGFRARSRAFRTEWRLPCSWS
jgi:hypothetical protein